MRWNFHNQTCAIYLAISGAKFLAKEGNSQITDIKFSTTISQTFVILRLRDLHNKTHQTWKHVPYTSHLLSKKTFEILMIISQIIIICTQ